MRVCAVLLWASDACAVAHALSAALLRGERAQSPSSSSSSQASAVERVSSSSFVVRVRDALERECVLHVRSHAGVPLFDAFIAEHGDAVRALVFDCDDAMLTRADASLAKLSETDADLTLDVTMMAASAASAAQQTEQQQQRIAASVWLRTPVPFVLHGFRSVGSSAAASARLCAPSVIDHFTLVVDDTQLLSAAQYYLDLGLTRLLWSRDEDVARGFLVDTGVSAMRSIITSSPAAHSFSVVLACPAASRGGQESQVGEFLRESGGGGVQHLAFNTRDLVDAVRDWRSAGFGFLPVPAAYYEELLDANHTKQLTRDGVAQWKALVHACQDVDALIDAGPDVESPLSALDAGATPAHDGGAHAVAAAPGPLYSIDGRRSMLLQIFTEPVFSARRTLFFEIIQRVGDAAGFGMRNVFALFRAVERSQLSHAHSAVSR